MRETVANIFADDRVQRAFRYLSDHETEILSDQIRLTSIPAPPFAELERGRVFAEDVQKIGFHPTIDGIGNVVVALESPVRNPLVISAHLDTVFPAATRLEERREGRNIFLPGISDNSAGLVALLWSLRVIKEYGLRFRRPVVAIANVGEEGEGNLRGVRHVFKDPPWFGKDCEFIAVDGAGIQRITHQALGSRRFRVRLEGPGGHSWADFGRPNAIHALGTAIHNFVTREATRRPGTSFNVGIVNGGISVNAIPSVASMEVDLRATAASKLEDLDLRFHRAVTDAAKSNGVECKFELIGERPSGSTPVGCPLVQAAVEITQKLGVEPHLDIGSTDANIPMAMGIPAIAIGAGGAAGNTHTSQEWFDPLRRDLGLHRVIALIAVLAGLA